MSEEGKVIKKVCIATFYGSENYGSNLQAIGLACTLSKMNYDVFFLGNVHIRTFLLKHPQMLYARIYNRINRKKKQSFFNPTFYEFSSERRLRLDKFNSTHFKVLNINNDAEWNRVVNENVVFASGSDIIWNPYRGYPEKMFLDFAYYSGLKRFAYASSFGAKDLPHKFYRAYKKYIGTMTAVGVREQAVADLLEPIVGREIQKVVDPTFLLTAEEWNTFSEKAELSADIIPEKYIFCYFVMEDPRYWEYVRRISAEMNMKIVVLPMHHLDEEQPYVIVSDGTPYEFIWLIKNASFICTDSFHVCAFSIQYKKEFYLLRRARKAEDAKFDDLLRRYKLEDRVVVNENVFERKANIDYTFTEEQLKKDREESFAFLKNTLDECEQ